MCLFQNEAKCVTTCYSVEIRIFSVFSVNMQVPFRYHLDGLGITNTLGWLVEVYNHIGALGD